MFIGKKSDKVINSIIISLVKKKKLNLEIHVNGKGWCFTKVLCYTPFLVSISPAKALLSSKKKTC